MPALTTVVLDQALRQCAAWRADGINLNVAVNLSASDLLDAELPTLVQALLANLNLPASALDLEITETVLLNDSAKVIPVLERLSQAGVRLAIDDYGTGYSSLSYLAALPVHDLKLDISFVQTMDRGGIAARRATSIVSSTISLATGLGLGFIAEGVETSTSLAQLTALGCETVQGYYVSRPLPSVELTAWIRARHEQRALPEGDAVQGGGVVLQDQAPGAGVELGERAAAVLEAVGVQAGRVREIGLEQDRLGAKDLDGAAQAGSFEPEAAVELALVVLRR
jgi:EAL domain-containing protein (putative c-di-GMP-specific phosphodiesterase class I)